MSLKIVFLREELKQNAKQIALIASFFFIVCCACEQSHWNTAEAHVMENIARMSKIKQQQYKTANRNAETLRSPHSCVRQYKKMKEFSPTSNSMYGHLRIRSLRG